MRHPVLLWDDWEVMLIALGDAARSRRFTTTAACWAAWRCSRARSSRSGSRRPNLVPSSADYRVAARRATSATSARPTLHRLTSRRRRARSRSTSTGPPLRTMGIWDADRDDRDHARRPSTSAQEVLARRRPRTVRWPHDRAAGRREHDRPSGGRTGSSHRARRRRSPASARAACRGRRAGCQECGPARSQADGRNLGIEPIAPDTGCRSRAADRPTPGCDRDRAVGAPSASRGAADARCPRP